jgi:hypothetical protein
MTILNLVREEIPKKYQKNSKIRIQYSQTFSIKVRFGTKFEENSKVSLYIHRESINIQIYMNYIRV